MEHIYPRKSDRCTLVKANPGTIRFLLDYSSSLRIVRHEGIAFESNMN